MPSLKYCYPYEIFRRKPILLKIQCRICGNVPRKLLLDSENKCYGEKCFITALKDGYFKETGMPSICSKDIIWFSQNELDNEEVACTSHKDCHWTGPLHSYDQHIRWYEFSKPPLGKIDQKIDKSKYIYDKYKFLFSYFNSQYSSLFLRISSKGYVVERAFTHSIRIMSNSLESFGLGKQFMLGYPRGGHYFGLCLKTTTDQNTNSAKFHKIGDSILCHKQFFSQTVCDF